MCCFPWLIKYCFEPMAGNNRTRRGKLGCMLEEGWSWEDVMDAQPEIDMLKLCCRPRPRDDTQINKNGLN